MKTRRPARRDEDERATNKKSGSSAGWMKTGAAIEKEAERLAAENERKAEQRKRTGGIDPNKTRFRLKPGDETEIVILDSEVDTVAFFEHHMKKDGKWGHFESCPGEWSNCPLCSSGDPKAFVWFLTILDRTPYEREDGTEVPYFRRLLPIKPSQANTYKRILKAAYKEHGTIRGVVLTVERDTGDKSAAIGEPVIRESSKMFDFMDEDELIEEFGHPAIKARNGDVLVKKNGLLQPFDYEVIFPKPDAKDIAKRWGLGPQAGSDDEYEEATDDEDDNPKAKSKSKQRPVDEDEDDADEEHEFLAIAKVADRKGATRNKTLDAAAEEHDLDPEDFDTWEELAEELVRLESKAKSKTAKKSAKRKPADDEDEDEDEPPRKTRKTRRASDDDDDDDRPF
jgi:hypothetical protein